MSEVHRGMYSLDAIAGTYKRALANLTYHKIIGDSRFNEDKNRLSRFFKLKYNLHDRELKNSKRWLEMQAQTDVIFYQAAAFVCEHGAVRFYSLYCFQA